MAGTCVVSRLSITAVKGLALSHPTTIELTADGARGDRQFFLVDDNGKIQSCTANAGLYGLRAIYDPDGGQMEVRRGSTLVRRAPVDSQRPVSVDMWGLRTLQGEAVTDPDWDRFFSELIGRRVTLVRASTSAYDVRPVTLLGAASVRELASHAGAAEVDSRRFRMLIEFEGAGPHVEDTWQDRVLEVGTARLRAGGPVKRCAATTRDPDTGEVNAQTLRNIAAYRGRAHTALGVGPTFGIYAEVLDPGKVSVGDDLWVSDITPLASGG